MVNGREYMLVLNLFREGGDKENPVKAVNKVTICTEDGKPLHLLPKSIPAQTSDPLPNCVTMGALFDAKLCFSPLLLTATKWPEYRTIKLEISLELDIAAGKTSLLMPSVHFLVWLLLVSQRVLRITITSIMYAF
jgi:hypothetical protein